MSFYQNVKYLESMLNPIVDIQTKLFCQNRMISKDRLIDEYIQILYVEHLCKHNFFVEAR